MTITDEPVSEERQSMVIFWNPVLSSNYLDMKYSTTKQCRDRDSEVSPSGDTCSPPKIQLNSSLAQVYSCVYRMNHLAITPKAWKECNSSECQSKELSHQDSRL